MTYRLPRFSDKRFIRFSHEPYYIEPAAWELGMLNYYMRKITLCNDRESVIEMLEYILMIPEFMAVNAVIRSVVSAKVEEFDRYSAEYNDPVWDHVIDSMRGFLKDLKYHPFYVV